MVTLLDAKIMQGDFAMIYLDNSATTKPYKEVIDTFVTVSNKYFGNPSSVHRLGTEAERLLSQSRNMCASMLDVKPNEIVFTSGGTEGNNLAIKGVAFQHQNRGKHMITTSIEHASSFEAFKQLENAGFEVTYLPVNQAGRISIADLKDALRNDTILVSILHVNNEMGAIQPIKEIAHVLKNYPKALFHVDHVQGIGKVSLQLNTTGIDLCTISGHKFHGLKGTGILTIREGIKLHPLLSGGGQEMQLRPGTENTAAIAAMTKALRMTLEKEKEKREDLEMLKRYFMDQVANIEGVKVNTPYEHSAPHIVNFSVLNVKPEVLIHSLEDYDIYVSSKSACSSKLPQASRVLLELGLGEERAKSAIRVSMSYETTSEDIDKLMDALSIVIPKLQKVMG